MRTVSDRHSLWDALAGWRAAGERIALVPTMGNLHAGHLSLLEVARRNADRVVATIFVNPTQFGEGEDFEAYPRTEAEDLAQLKAAGCDLAFTPAPDQVYPFGPDHAVVLKASPDLAGRLEGRFRPSHFDGVVTVVARLFAMVGPQVAVFGEKDYQQLLVIRRMTKDLGFNIEIVGAETVRAQSGLALSSRNAYLDDKERDAAQLLNRILADAAAPAAEGDRDFSTMERAAAEALNAAGLDVQYVAIRRAEDLAPPGNQDLNLRILAAAWCGKTRLIDNLAVDCSDAQKG